MLYLKIFDKSYVDKFPTTGVVLPKNLNFIRRVYHYNIDRLENYYQSKMFSVKKHIITDMVGLFPILSEHDRMFTFLSLAEDKLEQISRTYKLVSVLDKGKVQKAHFYGNGGDEIIIDEFLNKDPIKIKDDWVMYPAVTVLAHPRDDLRLLPPIGLDDGSRSGLSVLSIDMTALAIKFREFAKYQSRREKEDKPIEPRSTFVTKYVLPGMFKSDLDHRLLNRIINRFYGIPETIPKKRLRFRLPELDNQVNRYADEVIENITNKELDFIAVLKNIPLVFTNDASELLSFNYIPSNRQTNWAYLASRLRVMCFLYDVAGSHRRNQSYINDWKRLVKRLERDSALLGTFNKEVRRELDFYIEKIKEM